VAASLLLDIVATSTRGPGCEAGPLLKAHLINPYDVRET
jgi:hypothetical protein